jgi:hypothetical protein
MHRRLATLSKATILHQANPNTMRHHHSSNHNINMRHHHNNSLLRPPSHHLYPTGT